tara:strand:+ start:206 stop:472 length:267 start_codon:yes stop_codon:yes gene_type:complete
MIYQLPNGRIIEISLEMYLELDDFEIRELNGLSNSHSSEINNPFYKSVLKGKQSKEEDIFDVEEKEPSLDEIEKIEKMEDDYFHRDDV